MQAPVRTIVAPAVTVGIGGLVTGRCRRLILVPVFVLAAAIAVSAHRDDEFLQASRIALDETHVRIELNLTPGIAVAEAVLRDIDANGDGILSPAEQQAYAGRVVKGLTLRVDQSTPLALTLAGSSFPDPAAIRKGDGAISVRIGADLPRMAQGNHSLDFRNDHAPAGSVYLANALVPGSPRLSITAQRRDTDQRGLILDFTVAEASGRGRWRWIGFAFTLVLSILLARRAETWLKRTGRPQR